MTSPVFILAFANNAVDRERALDALEKERERLQSVLGDKSGHKRWELVPSPQTSISRFLDLIQTEEYRSRIAILHFAGHADGQSLLMESDGGAPEVADARGIAEFLRAHPGLGFVFLNACSTVGQVHDLLDAGVPAVIATEHEVNDQVAAEFSSRFYKELVAGQTLRKAFDAAAGAVKSSATLRTAAETRSIKGVGVKRDPGDWPWALHVREGNKAADQWSLGLALKDPLWGVPELSVQSLPDAPFRHLQPFRAEDAPIFFGRRRETRAIYDAIEHEGARRVVLLHGVSGAGKSSLLEAGVLPRLIGVRDVRYRRRTAGGTLVGDLFALLGLPAEALPASLANPSAKRDDDGTAARHAAGVAAAAAWKALETDKRPLTVILDQVEEAFADANAGRVELADLVAVLKLVLDDAQIASGVKGSVVLGFRKEWLAELQAQLNVVALASTDIFLDRLDTDGIAEAVEGVTRDDALREHFRLTIPESDSGLARQIAEDLKVDASSAIAPTLQVLLTKMWERAVAAGTPDRQFTCTMYEALQKDGALLNDFVDQQLEALGKRPELAEAASRGLVLDVLALHVTPLGDATRSISRADRLTRYPEARHAEVELILRAASEARLVADSPEPDAPAGSLGSTRLAHDTIAPYIRRLSAQSDLPVQRAQRALEQRAEEWTSTVVVTKAERRATWIRRVVAVPGRVGRWAWRWMKAPYHFVVHVALDVRDVWRAWRGRVKSVRPGRPLGRTDLALVETGVPWMRELRPEERVMLRASRGAHAWAHLGRVAAALTLLVFVVSAWRAGNRVRARGILAQVNNAADDPLKRFLLMREIADEDSLPGGVQVAADVVGRPIPYVRFASTDGLVLGAAFSRDSQRVLSWTSRHVAVWNTRSADGDPPVADLPYQSNIAQADLSPDGRCFVTGDSAGMVLVTDVATHQAVGLWQGPTRVVGVQYSADGSQFAAANDAGNVSVWSGAHTGCGTTETWGAPREIKLGTPSVRGGSQFQFLPDGGLLTIGDSVQGVSIWRRDGTVRPIARDAGIVTGGAASADGRHLVLWDTNGLLRFMALDTNGVTRTVGSVTVTGTAGTWIAALDPHGDRVAVHPGFGDSVIVISTRSLGAQQDTSRTDPLEGLVAERLVLRGHRGNVRGIAFSADGTRLLTYASDGSALLWSFNFDPSGRIPVRLATGTTVRAASFNTAGTEVVTAQDSSLRLWKAREPSEPAVMRTGVHANARATMLPDGRIIAVGGPGLTIRDSNFKELGTISVPPRTTLTFAVDQDAKRIAIAVDDSVMIVPLGARSGAPVWQVRVPDSLRYRRPLAFSHDGKWLALGYALGVALYRTDSASAVPRFSAIAKQHYSVMSLAFAPRDSDILAGDWGGRRFHWNFRSGNVRYFHTLDAAVWDLAMSEKTGLYAYALGTGLAKVGPVSEAQTHTLIGEGRGAFYSVGFSPSGDRVVTASYDGTARVWSARDGVLIATLRGHGGPVMSAEFTPDGERVLTASNDGTVRLWRVTWKGLMSRILESRSKTCLNMQERQNMFGENMIVAAWGATCIFADTLP